MGVFSEKADEQRRKDAALHAKLQDDAADKERRLVAIETSAAQFLASLARVFEEACKEAPELGFIARALPVRDKLPSPQVGMKLEFERNPVLRGQSIFSFRVLVQENLATHSSLFKREGERGQFIQLGNPVSLGPIDHIDVQERLKAELSRAVDIAQTSR